MIPARQQQVLAAQSRRTEDTCSCVLCRSARKLEAENAAMRAKLTPETSDELRPYQRQR